MLPSLVSYRKWLLPGSASLAVLLLGAASPVYAQLPIYPTISFSPTNPISTEPTTIIFTSASPDGTYYNVRVNAYAPPHAFAGECTATQKNGAASCVLGRIPDGYFITSIQGNSGYIQPLGFGVAGPGNSTVSALQGQYAFLVTNQSSESSTVPNASAAAGSFTADGQGNITAGVMDLNKAGTTLQNLSITGKYQLDANGQGNIMLTTSQGTVSLAVVVPTAQTTSNIVSGNLVASAGGLVTGAGRLVNQSGKLQSTSPVNPGFAPYLSGGYQSTLTGETSPVPTPVAGVAQFAFTAAGSVTSAGQLIVNGTEVPFAELKGTYDLVDGTTGRTTMTLSGPGQPSTTYAVYETSEQSFYFLSLASHAANALIAGTGSSNQ